MPTKPLPPQPNLAHLKGQAADLLKGHADRSPAVAQRLREFLPRFRTASDAQIFAAGLRRSDACLAIAREYGFASWPRLKAVVEGPEREILQRPLVEQICDLTFRSAVEMMDAGDVDALRETLRANPSLATQRVRFEGMNYFRNPCLLDFIAENPIRNGTLPPNILDVALAIIRGNRPFPKEQLESAAGLVASGGVARKCGVQGDLLTLLCGHGADPAEVLGSALSHGELDAARRLLELGAPMTLQAAATLGGVEEFARLLRRSGTAERHLALAVSAGFGNLPELELLLESGEDPNRYNPPGYHSHSTPLHQAAVGGHLDAVKCLIRHHADPTMLDTMWNGTPAGWARHGGKMEVAEYLESSQLA